MNLDMLPLVRIAREAGETILDVYDSDFAVEHKEDESPLTEADRRAHQCIVDGLKKWDPDTPVLSEEGRDIPYEERKTWNRFWLVDPLDGTKEFVKRNGEFTVNIALVQGTWPVAGVIDVPVWDTIYFAKPGKGAYKLTLSRETLDRCSTEEELLEAATGLPDSDTSRPRTVIASRSHRSPETETFIEEKQQAYGDVAVESVGSSLKLCRIAEGRADWYPRFAPTMEWDTGAGQAIVEATGGVVVDYHRNRSLPYNKENLKNPWFLAHREDSQS